MLQLEPDGDWLQGVRRLQSPNCNERPPGCAIDLLVVHGISLPPGEFGGPHIDALFCNRLDPDLHPFFREIAGLKVSAHLLIDRRGGLTQYVSFLERAWHAGHSCFEGRDECNGYSIGVELEGTDEIPYEAVQYSRLAELYAVLCSRWPGITPERVVGHCDVAPGRKSDPGPAFDWDHLFSLIGEDRTGK